MAFGGGFADIPIVIDNGTGTIKVGEAERPWPQAQIPNVVGVAKHRRVLLSAPKREKEIGDMALNRKGLLRLSYPMKHGVIDNMQDMNDVWEYIYKDVLKLQGKSISEHPVLLTEAPHNPIQNRRRMANQFFEAYDVPALFFAPQPVLALYATGRTTGCVLDSGHGVTQCVPIYDGFALPHAITRMDVAGHDVDLYFQHLLRKLSGVTFHTTSELEVVRDLKEKHCQLMHVRPQQRTGMMSMKKVAKKDDTIPVKLPDNKEIQVGSARFRAPELLFEPEAIGLEYRGIHYCVLDSVAKADLELRRTLYQTILLSGGSTMFEGFGQRLLNELKTNCEAKNPKFKIFAPVKRNLTTWVGGSVLATLQAFAPMWITKKEMDEEGERVLFRKTFL